MFITKKRHEQELIAMKAKYDKAYDAGLEDLRRQSAIVSDMMKRVKLMKVGVKGPVNKDWTYRLEIEIDPNMLTRLLSRNSERVKFIADSIAHRAYRELMAFANMMPRGVEAEAQPTPGIEEVDDGQGHE